MTTLDATYQDTTAFHAYTREDVGKLVLRLTVGILILMHGISKLVSGPGAIASLLEHNGLPGALAYLAYVGEVLAPVFVIVGVWTRPAALLVAVNMVVAVALAHRDDLFMLGSSGGWALELQGFYLFGAVAVALLGAGGLSAGGKAARWN